ncbi:MAG TPA: metal-dependent hydrolase [Candidatus Kapabacteria bacterium]|nr:metal-dependent hydrolase [Candidatus Kapabacteria bacterium]
MASAFTHGFVGLALGRLSTAEPQPRRFWVLAALCAILPDIDAMGYMMGVDYASMWGHRGIVHSLLFALLAGVAVALLAFPSVSRWSREWWRLVLFFFVATASHGLLDALTTGGLGVAFFAPFSGTRYFLPWRVIRVSPIGVGSFFSARGVAVIASEALWVWLPTLVLLAIAWLVRRRRSLPC